MSLYLIKGQYRLVPSEPDGESVVEVDGQAVRLTRDITDLIFVEG